MAACPVELEEVVCQAGNSELNGTIPEGETRCARVAPLACGKLVESSSVVREFAKTDRVVG